MARKKVRPAASPRGPERKHTTMRLSTELRADLKKIAAQQNRSVSNLIEGALVDFARRHRPRAEAAVDLFD